jgi:putative tricarboxylic transport membrane protein
MDTLNLFINGLEIAIQPYNLLSVFIGVFIGQVLGILPGIGPAAGMALLMPVTFGMPPVTAIVMLTGIMYGGMYGGTLTSVLINVPGEASSVMTAIDGNQLAKQGKAGAALSVAAIGSFLAGTLSIFPLMFGVTALTSIALQFSAAELFLLGMLGLTVSANLGLSTPVKSLFVASVGLLIAMIGLDPASGLPRLTFGSGALLEGIDFLPVAIGIFGVAEVLASLEKIYDDKPLPTRLADLWLTREDWSRSWRAMLRGGVIGFGLGTLPGCGPTIASIVAYVVEKKFSRWPERFGRGALDGVAASESANNSAVTGALVPMLSLGIPGSNGTAILLSALVLVGIRPGPGLMTSQPDLVWGLIGSMFVGNFLLLLMNLPLAPLFASFLRVPYSYLAPGILLVSLVGAYSGTLDQFTLVVTMTFGMIGYIMLKAGLPRAPLILALVLAPMIEDSLRQSLQLSEGSLLIFVERPIAAVLSVVLLLSLAVPIVRTVRGIRRHTEEPANPVLGSDELADAKPGN